MRILHIYKDYSPILGGIENHIKTLAELEAQAGHHVTVLVTNPAHYPSHETINGVHLIRTWRLATVASTPLTGGFLTELPRLKPDITHLHFPYPIGEVSQLLAGKKPYIITYHSDVVRQQSILRFYRPLMQRVLRGAARILPTSDRYIASSPYLKPLAAQCTVVPLSVDPVPFANPTPLCPPADVPTLVFIGRHRYYKGLDTLIRAMPTLNARLLVGGDGPMREAWEALAGELGVSGKVQFLGEVSDEDLPAFFASGDVFVLPANSRAEAFGKVLLEAMATGLPCVTTELGTGTSFVVQDGVTGFVVPPQDPAALGVVIQRLLEDARLRKTMGTAGRARVVSEFTPEKLLERTQRIYREVLDS
ncbi:MAG TPA: glycosyltransferase [Anaerolineales bacterium]|nr:glycosyltransferase [Anaerolineales bacterium]